MNQDSLLQKIKTASAFIRHKTDHVPEIGLVLGSGLGDLAKEIKDAVRIDYQEIPNWPASTVKGHSGELYFGKLQGKTVMVMRGRAHYYEGQTIQEITLPIRVMQDLGINTIVLTNAAGGLRNDLRAGDLMLISDHINMIGMGGTNPLRGPNLDEFGPRFPDMTEVYDPELRELAKKIATEGKIPLKEGVYVAIAGPSFETPADLRFLRMIGADAVGMSTVPEAIVARHGGTRLLAISGISNTPAMEPGKPAKTTHEEVLETGAIIVPRLLYLLKGVLEAISI